MGEVFEFPSRRVQMKVQLERMLRSVFSNQPKSTVDLVVGSVLEKFDEYYERLPFRFEISLPSETTPEQIQAIKDHFESLRTKLEELALDNMAMTARLMIAESNDQ